MLFGVLCIRLDFWEILMVDNPCHGNSMCSLLPSALSFPKFVFVLVYIFVIFFYLYCHVRGGGVVRGEWYKVKSGPHLLCCRLTLNLLFIILLCCQGAWDVRRQWSKVESGPHLLIFVVVF